MPILDMLSQDLIDNPYPTYEQIRAHGDVVWDEGNQAWLISSDRLCRNLLANFAESGPQDTPAAGLFGEEAFIVIDDKRRHDALRSVWYSAFRPNALASLEVKIAVMVDGLLAPAVDRLKAGETVDIIPAFCRDLPVQVISEMFGTANEMRPFIIKWSDEMMGGLTNKGDTATPEHIIVEDAKKNLAQYIYDEIRDRRANPTDDLIGQMVKSEVGKTLSDEEMMVNCRQLLFAGNETTARWLAQGVYTLGRRPEELAAVLQDFDRVPAVMEEVMRWDPVTQLLRRRVKVKPIEAGGQVMNPGDLIILLIGAANRDPERYEDPSVFNTHRVQKGHLGFGFGLHHCLGASLARFEVGVAMPRFLKAVSHYVIDGPVAYSNPIARSPDNIDIRIH